MRREKPTNTPEAASKPDQILAFPGQGDNTVQLAEEYTARGSRFDWESNPYTRHDNKDRRAVIYADNEGEQKLYYLCGDTLFDINELRKDIKDQDLSKLPALKLTEATKLYPMSIGEPTLVTKEQGITDKIVVKTQRVTRGHKEGDKLLKNALEVNHNLFNDLDNELTEIIGKREQAKQRKARAGKVALEFGYQAGITNERTVLWRDESVRDPITGASKEEISNAGMEQLAEELTGVPFVRSRDGVVAQPQPGVREVRDSTDRVIGKERDAPEYRPRLGAWIGMLASVHVGPAFDRLHRKHARHERQERREGTRELLKTEKPDRKFFRENEFNPKVDTEFFREPDRNKK